MDPIQQLVALTVAVAVCGLIAWTGTGVARWAWRRLGGRSRFGSRRKAARSMGLSRSDAADLDAALSRVWSEERASAHRRAFDYLTSLATRQVQVAHVEPSSDPDLPDVYEFSDGTTVALSPGGSPGARTLRGELARGQIVLLAAVDGHAEAYAFTFQAGSSTHRSRAALVSIR